MSQGYRFGTHAGQARSHREPSKLLKPNVAAKVVKASWNHTSTIFRPYPVHLNGVPQPYRYNDDEGNFTDWIRSYRAVMGVGPIGIDFILCDPSDPSVDRAMNPYELVFAYVEGLKKANSLPNHIFQMTQSGAGRGSQIPKTTALTVMQGALLVQKNEPKIPAEGSALNDPTIVMAVKQQVGEAVTAFCNQRRDPATQPADPARCAVDPYAERFFYGDITHLQAGAFLHFIQKGGVAPGQAPPTAFGGQRQQTPGGQQQRVEIGYDVSIMDRLPNGITPDMSGIADMVASKWKDWDSILHIPTVAEQVQYLSAALPPDLIVSALADRYREMIPQHVMAAGSGRISSGSAYGAPPPNTAYSLPPPNPYGAPPPAGGYGAPPPPPAHGGYGYDRPIDLPPPHPPAQGQGEYAWPNSQQGGYAPPPPPPQGGGYGAPPLHGGYAPPPPPPNPYGAPPPSGGYGTPPPQGGGYGAPPPPQGGGYGAPPPQGGGYGAPPPPANGGYGAPPPPAGGYGAPPPPAGGYGAPPPPANGGYGAPPPQTGFGSAAPPPQTGMMTPPPPAPGGVDVNSAIENARRSAAANTQPPRPAGQ